jgi:hypothetical protein
MTGKLRLGEIREMKRGYTILPGCAEAVFNDPDERLRNREEDF